MKGKYIILAGFVCTLLGVKAYCGVYQTTLNGLSISVDEQTGCLLELSYPSTGMILQAKPDSGGLLDIAYPVDGFQPIRLASRFSNAKLTKGENEVTIFYEKLGPSRTHVSLPEGNVKARVKIKAADDSRSVIMTCEIWNNTNNKIGQILFPDLKGLLPFAGHSETKLKMGSGEVKPFISTRRPHTAPLYATPAHGGTRLMHYSTEQFSRPSTINTLRWVDYGGLQGGLSIFEKKWQQDNRSDIWTFHQKELSPTLRLCFDPKVSINPGQSWISGEYWFTPHEGGWAKGIEVYRDYVRQKLAQRPPVPDHVKDGLGFRSIWMIEPLETDPAMADFRYEDIPQVARDALEHGLKEVVAWGCTNYFALPVEIRQELGTEEQLSKAVKKARQMGVNFSPFLSIILINPKNAEKYGKKNVKGQSWAYHTDFFPLFRPNYIEDGSMSGVGIEPTNPTWRKDVLDSMMKLMDLGIYSFCWDTFKGVGNNQHTLVEFAKEVRQIARAKDPQSTFSGEIVSFEHDTEVADYSWWWKNYMDNGPVLNLSCGLRLNCNVEDSALVAKQAFADGLYINVMCRRPARPNGTGYIKEFPALSVALKEVTARREQFLPFFTQGTFIGECILDKYCKSFVRAHKLGNEILIIVLNQDERQSKKVDIESNTALWLPKGECVIKYYDKSGKLLKTKKVSIEKSKSLQLQTEVLKPLELAFFKLSCEN